MCNIDMCKWIRLNDYAHTNTLMTTCDRNPPNSVVVDSIRFSVFKSNACIIWHFGRSEWIEKVFPELFCVRIWFCQILSKVESAEITGRWERCSFFQPNFSNHFRGTTTHSPFATLIVIRFRWELCWRSIRSVCDGFIYNFHLMIITIRRRFEMFIYSMRRRNHIEF